MPVVSPEKAERRKRMVNLEMLRQHIEDSGITMSHIARRLDISRATIYNKLIGSSEFTANEMFWPAARLVFIFTVPAERLVPMAVIRPRSNSFFTFIMMFFNC